MGGYTDPQGERTYFGALHLGITATRNWSMCQLAPGSIPRLSEVDLGENAAAGTSKSPSSRKKSHRPRPPLGGAQELFARCASRAGPMTVGFVILRTWD